MPDGAELQDQGASGSAESLDSKPVSAGGRQNRKQESFEYRIKKLQKKMLTKHYYITFHSNFRGVIAIRYSQFH